MNATLGLTAYRVVQEALTNVLKHAGAGADPRVTVTYAPDSIDLRGRRLRAGVCWRPPTAVATACAAWRNASAPTAARSRSDPVARPATASTRGSRWSRPQQRGSTHDHTRAARRRPGAGPQRLPHAHRVERRPRGRGRGRERGRGADDPGDDACRRRADGHPDARHGRRRGDPAHRRVRGPRARARADDVRRRRVRVRARCAPGPVASCSRTAAPTTCSRRSGAWPPATR